MASILVRDLSQELEASLQAYASQRGLSLSQAAVELMRLGMESETIDGKSGEGVHMGDFLAETLKEALHTTDEADQFIRSHEEIDRKPVSLGTKLA
jgi:plasmid stability protein